MNLKNLNEAHCGAEEDLEEAHCGAEEDLEESEDKTSS